MLSVPRPHIIPGDSPGCAMPLQPGRDSDGGCRHARNLAESHGVVEGSGAVVFKRKPTPEQLERRIRRRSGKIWFTLNKFIDDDTLYEWAVIANRPYHPEN